MSNSSVTEEHILAGHFQATARRAASCDGTLLVLQDTTEFVYQRSAPDSIGYTKNVNSGRDKEGRWRQHKLCGVMMLRIPTMARMYSDLMPRSVPI